MRIYEIKLKEHDYDEFDGWIVIARDEEEAIKLCDIKETKEEITGYGENQYKDNIEYIKEIGIADYRMEKGIVLGSYNAG